MMEKMFFEKKSKLSFEETFELLGKAASKNNWDVLHTLDLQKIYQDAGHKDMTKCKTIAICRPHSAYQILEVDKNKRMAALMPIQLAIYEDKKGDVYISAISLGFMGKMFGGVIEEVMNGACNDLDKTLEGIIEE